LIIYPNPANFQLNVNVNNGENFLFEVFNGAGQQVLSGNKTGPFLINTEDWSPGIYFLRLTGHAGTITDRFIVAR
jgi:hypothetical protein